MCCPNAGGFVLGDNARFHAIFQIGVHEAIQSCEVAQNSEYYQAYNERVDDLAL